MYSFKTKATRIHYMQFPCVSFCMQNLNIHSYTFIDHYIELKCPCDCSAQELCPPPRLDAKYALGYEVALQRVHRKNFLIIRGLIRGLIAATASERR